ncbi:hypothetical protein [Kibdelosporangium aridum]|uniref:hypothetical protein n=1 Tax=Kibdelosporangium aridum TaxID=2030 RepID=UPI00068EE72B|nr:hypothetical protein [Kibdelosporangium aridum]
MSDEGADAAARKLPLRHSDDIQGDILAGFRKDHETVLLLRFPDDPRPVRKWLRQLIPQISTTRQVAAFNSEFSAARHTFAGTDPAGLSATWVNLSLTYTGLKFLMGTEPFPDKTPRGVQAFVQGAFARAGIVLTFASDEQAKLELRASELRVGEGKGHEHFGFKDGISQPGVRDFDRPDPRDPIHVDGKPGTRILPAGEFVAGHPKLTGDAPPLPEWTRNGFVPGGATADTRRAGLVGAGRCRAQAARQGGGRTASRHRHRVAGRPGGRQVAFGCVGGAQPEHRTTDQTGRAGRQPDQLRRRRARSHHTAFRPYPENQPA